jgi:hypothetical protein
VRISRENALAASLNFARCACSAALFVIGHFNDARFDEVIEVQAGWLKADCADTESLCLAIKKFSCLAPSCLIIPPQNRIFARIDVADSETRFARMRGLVARREGAAHASMRMRAARATGASELKLTSDAELGFEQIAHGLRVGFAAG